MGLPMRIQNRASQINQAMAAGISVVVAVIALMVGCRVAVEGGVTSGLDVFMFLIVVFGLWLATYVVIRLIGLLVRGTGTRSPDWIEIGERLTIARGKTVQHFDWQDVACIRFGYSHWYSEPGDEVYTINLFVSLSNGKKIEATIGGSGNAGPSVTDVLNAVVVGLRDDTVSVRQASARILELVSGDFPYLYETSQIHDPDHKERAADATSALDVVRQAISDLERLYRADDPMLSTPAAVVLDRYKTLQGI